MMTPLTMEQAAKIWKSYQNTTTHLITTTTVQAAQQVQAIQNPFLQQINAASSMNCTPYGLAASAQISRDYGEQCADTDGLAAWKRDAEQLLYHDLDVIAKLTARAEQAERNLETAIKERDALQVELNQRMAMPVRALKFSA